jgi:hypothetical protein
MDIAGRSMRGKRARLQSERTPVHGVIERRSQAAMVIILKRDEAERLQYAAGHLAHGTEDFGHAMNWAGLGLKGNFDKVTLSQTMGHLQQPTGHGNGLEFSFCTPAVFEADRSQDRIS